MLKDISTGAGNDIQQATRIANKMVTEWGMSEAVGPITLSAGPEQVFLGRDIGMDREFGEDTAEMIDQEVHDIVQSSYIKARKILSDHIDMLHALAKMLVEQETVDAAELESLMKPA